MTLDLALKEFGGENCSNMDNILIITLGSAIRIWGNRCKNVKIDTKLECLEYTDTTTGLRQVFNLDSIESITLETDESRNNPKNHMV